MASGGSSKGISQETINKTSDSTSSESSTMSSAMLAPTTSQSNTTIQGVFTFADANQGETIDMSTTGRDISEMDHFGETDLDKFFARPRQIQEYSWTPAFSFATFYPWEAYFNNTIISKKLENYAYIRCKLHLKFVVNASPYYFGAMQCAYFPMNMDFSAQSYSQPDVAAALTPYVQSVLPHVVLEPQYNQGGEIVLPFIYDRNFLSLEDNTNLQLFGSVFLEQLVTLRDVQGGTPACTIQVYAWASEVTLTGTTSLAVLQSDEFGDRPVSKVATAVAKAASAFSSIPVIGPFATATSIGAKAISAIATIFGYTNVPSLEPAHALRPTSLGDFASASIGSSIEKLSLDPKNELSVDPKIVGVEEDHMAIQNIISRKGLINIISWSPADATQTCIYSSRVTPTFNQIGSKQLYLPPISHIAPLFGQWRGDIIFTFRCVFTVFHRGRVRIAWDPVNTPMQTLDGSLNAYSYLWDLSKEKEVEFRVPYQALTAFLRVNGNVTTVNQGITGQTKDSYSNGVISLITETVLNPVGPAPGVTILVYVRAAENFVFANPVNVLNNDNSSLKISHFAPQSGFEESSQTTEWSISKTKDDDNLYRVHMGEQVASIRPLLLRTNFYHTSDATQASTTLPQKMRLTIPRKPRFFGYDKIGFDLARNQALSANVNFNWVAQTPYTWLAPGFIYERGSHIYRVISDFAQGGISATRTSITENPSTTTFPLGNGLQLGVDTIGVGTSRDNIVLRYGTSAKGCGASVGSSDVNNSVQIAAPLYSEYRAISTLPQNSCAPPNTVVLAGVVQSSFNEPSFDSAIGRDYLTFETLVPPTTTARPGRFEVFHAVGIDFSLVFYRGCPRLYLYDSVPEVAV